MKNLVLLTTFVWCMTLSAAEPAKKSDFKAAFEKEWFTCKSDSDCTAVQGVCNWACVNKTREADFTRHAKEMLKSAECRAQNNAPRPAPLCEKNLCTCKL